MTELKAHPEQVPSKKLISRRKHREKRRILKKTSKRTFLSWCLKLFNLEPPKNLHPALTALGVVVVLILILSFSSMKSYLSGYFYERGIKDANDYGHQNLPIQGAVLGTNNSIFDLPMQKPNQSTSTISSSTPSLKIR